MDIHDRVSGPGVFPGSHILDGSLHSVRRDTGMSPIVHPKFERDLRRVL